MSLTTRRWGKRPLSPAMAAAALILQLALISGLLTQVGFGAGLVVVLPLLAPLPGLLRRRTYTAAWASMLLAFYCAGLLAEAYMRADKLPYLLLATVAALQFTVLVLFVRFAARERAASAGQMPPSDVVSP